MMQYLTDLSYCIYWYMYAPMLKDAISHCVYTGIYAPVLKDAISHCVYTGIYAPVLNDAISHCVYTGIYAPVLNDAISHCVYTGIYTVFLACNCDITGSFNKTCEKLGGQCPCKPGVTGRTCDKCLPHHFNFTSEGCTGRRQFNLLLHLI